MSDSVVKLRLDSGEYDSKIKRAAQNVLAFGENCQKAGQSVAKAEKETLDYVRSIGQMDTVAKNTKGKINEMTTAFTELSMQYKQLSAQEKQSPFGQALSQSLDQLKTRIGESKAQLTEVNAELGNTSKQSKETGGILDALAGKFGLNVSQLGKLGSALGVTTAAVKVAKDAFFASEQNLDDWNRTVYSAQSTYEAFLTALNTGDISGFLNNISRIVNAAKAAYDAIDWLNTQAAINNPKVKAQMAENARFDQMLKTGTYIAPAAGSGLMPTMAEGTKLTPAQLRAIQSQRANGQRTLMNYKNIELGALNNTIGRLYEEQAANLGMSRGQFMAGVADSDTFKKNLDMYNKYKAFEKAHTTTQRVETGYLGGQTRLKTVRDNAINPYAAYKGWGVFKDDGRLFKQINGYIDQRASLQSSIYSDYGQMYRTFNRVDNRLSGGGGGGSRGGGGGGTNTPPPPPAGSIAEQEAKVQALTKAWREATDEVGRAGYAGMLEEAKQVLDQMQGKTKEVIPEGSFKDLKNQLGDLQKQRELLADPVDIAVIDQDIERIKEKINTLNGVMKQGSTPMSLEEKIRTDLADSITAVDENTLTNLLEFKIKNGLDNLDINSDYLKQAIFGERMDISDDYWQDLAERINEQLASMGIEPITIDVKTGEVVQAAKKAKDGWQDAAQAVQAVGGALQQLEDPGAKIMGIIGEAIANIALGFAQATAQASVGGPFAWIAAIAGGLGTMLSTIAAIKSATAGSYAEGGIVPGNNYSDGLIANVSSGELILNRAQQNSIAGLLTSNQGNSESRPYVDVETIWLGLGHYLNRKGMGEIVTTR